MFKPFDWCYRITIASVETIALVNAEFSVGSYSGATVVGDCGNGSALWEPYCRNRAKLIKLIQQYSFGYLFARR